MQNMPHVVGLGCFGLGHHLMDIHGTLLSTGWAARHSVAVPFPSTVQWMKHVVDASRILLADLAFTTITVQHGTDELFSRSVSAVLGWWGPWLFAHD